MSLFHGGDTSITLSVEAEEVLTAHERRPSFLWDVSRSPSSAIVTNVWEPLDRVLTRTHREALHAHS